jgi:hypothetical protein
VAGEVCFLVERFSADFAQERHICKLKKMKSLFGFEIGEAL